MMLNRFSKIMKAASIAVLAFGVTAAGVYAGDASSRPEKCVVNGDKFSEHKKAPITVSHDGQSMDVCCRKCARKFEKEPDKYLKLYKEAQAEAGTTASAKGAKVTKTDSAEK